MLPQSEHGTGHGSHSSGCSSLSRPRSRSGRGCGHQAKFSISQATKLHIDHSRDRACKRRERHLISARGGRRAAGPSPVLASITHKVSTRLPPDASAAVRFSFTLLPSTRTRDEALRKDVGSSRDASRNHAVARAEHAVEQHEE